MNIAGLKQIKVCSFLYMLFKQRRSHSEKMCRFCSAIIKREERYLNTNLDLSVNLFLRLQFTEHFTVEQLKWLKNNIESDQFCLHLTRLLPMEFVRNAVWETLTTKYRTIIAEAIRAAYDAKKKNKGA